MQVPGSGALRGWSGLGSSADKHESMLTDEERIANVHPPFHVLVVPLYPPHAADTIGMWAIANIALGIVQSDPVDILRPRITARSECTSSPGFPRNPLHPVTVQLTAAIWR